MTLQNTAQGPNQQRVLNIQPSRQDTPLNPNQQWPPNRPLQPQNSPQNQNQWNSQNNVAPSQMQKCHSNHPNQQRKTQTEPAYQITHTPQLEHARQVNGIHRNSNLKTHTATNKSWDANSKVTNDKGINFRSQFAVLPQNIAESQIGFFDGRKNNFSDRAHSRVKRTSDCGRSKKRRARLMKERISQRKLRWQNSKQRRSMKDEILNPVLPL
ncbi:unnamed protein product [Bemisia tabaci]|uniref:Uncharacterized protein n=1 Tax=Bemisia tabaci TaxID=7038 RepID=A0A9P0A3A6_BEMTA|nr:unnamed protein product [Bemisia tabaci]